jgi:hypothetical protein
MEPRPSDITKLAKPVDHRQLVLSDREKARKRQDHEQQRRGDDPGRLYIITHDLPSRLFPTRASTYFPLAHATVVAVRRCLGGAAAPFAGRKQITD